MKKRKIIIISVLLVCLLCALVFQACGERTELPETKPVSVDSYLSELSGFVADGFDPSNGLIDFSLSGQAEQDGQSFDFEFSFVCDLTDIQKSVFVAELKKDGQEVFSVLAKDGFSYVTVAPNDYVGDAKIKLLNTGVFSWLKSALVESGASNAKNEFKDFVFKLGKLLFREADVNVAKTEYTFFFKDNFSSGNSVSDLKNLMDVFDESALKTIFSVFEINSAEELAGKLPAASGSLTFQIGEGRVKGIKSEGLKIGDVPEFSFALSVAADDIDRGRLEDKFPGNDTGYLVTKIGNMTSKGTMSLYASTGNKRAAIFDYEVNMNMDLINLLAAGYDLSKLSDDNYFHFSLSHNCGGFCTEFCRSKLKWEQSDQPEAVLDIVYSPKDLGHKNVNIVVNMMYVLGEDYLKSINKYPLDISKTSLPNYCIFTVPYEDFTKDSALKDLLILLCSDMLFKKDGYSLETNKLASMLPEGGLARELFSSFLVSDEFSNDIIRVKTDYRRYGQSNEYDIYEKAFTDPRTGKLKAYNHATLDIVLRNTLKYGALDWTFEDAFLTEDGVLLNNIYSADGRVMHGVSEGRYVPLSPYEARGLAGHFLKVDCLNFKKETDAGVLLEIVAVEEIDYSTRAVQTVKLKLRYPSPLDFVFVEKLFEGYADDFCISVSVQLKLTDEASTEFRQGISENAVFMPVYDSLTPPEFLTGIFTINYVNGVSKDISVEGQSDGVVLIWTTHPSLGEKKYSVVNWGNIAVDFHVANRKVSKIYRIKTPDRLEYEIDASRMGSPVVGSSFLTSTLPLNSKLYAYYGETRVQIKLLPEDYFINGISITKNSSYWESFPSILTGADRLVFFIANDYVVKISKNGIESEEFVLSVKR